MKEEMLARIMERRREEKEIVVDDLVRKIMEIVHEDERIDGFCGGRWMNDAEDRCESEIHGALMDYISGVKSDE